MLIVKNVKLMVLIIKKLIRIHKRRRYFNKLSEIEKEILIYVGVSPKQLEEKEEINQNPAL